MTAVIYSIIYTIDVEPCFKAPRLLYNAFFISAV